MRLESALYASRSGLTAEGQAIAVVSDNISNVNTTGYKTARTEFSDILDTGQGVQVQRVRNIHEVGLIEDTGRALDAAIAGNGFFVVGSTTNPYYTRAGNFSIRSDGVLATADGQAVLGLKGTSTTLGEINILDVATGSSTTSKVLLNGNLDATQKIKPAPTNPATFTDLGSEANFVFPITVFDSLGTAHSINVAATKTGVNAWVAQAYIDGSEVGGTAGQPVQIGQNATLNFNNSGGIDAANTAAAVITANPNYSDGATQGNFTINLGSITQVSATSQILVASQDGTRQGNVKTFRIDDDGKILAVLDSGTEIDVGQLQIATVGNPDSLDRVGSNMFASTAESGPISLGNAGDGSAGKIQSYALERSTVDLANSFVDLVLFQRGYQANSQALNAANELIKDTTGLLR